MYQDNAQRIRDEPVPAGGDGRLSPKVVIPCFTTFTFFHAHILEGSIQFIPLVIVYISKVYEILRICKDQSNSKACYLSQLKNMDDF